MESGVLSLHQPTTFVNDRPAYTTRLTLPIMPRNRSWVQTGQLQKIYEAPCFEQFDFVQRIRARNRLLGVKLLGYRAL